VNAKDWITLVIALAGFCLSLYVAIVQRRDKRELLRIDVNPGVHTQGSSVSSLLCVITARNVGERTVTLSNFGLILPSGQQIIDATTPQQHPLPYALVAGASCTMLMPFSNAVEAAVRAGYSGLIKVRPYFDAQSGKRHIGNPNRLQV